MKKTLKLTLKLIFMSLLVVNMIVVCNAKALANDKTEDSEKPPLVVAYMGNSATHGFWKDVSDSIEEAFTSAGIEFHQAFTEEDPTQMRLAYETFLSQGVNFILDGNCSAEKAEVFAAQAKEQGINFMTIECSTESAYSYGMSNQDAGEISGEYIVDAVNDLWDGECDLVVLMGTFTYAPQCAPRVTGAYDIMKEKLDIDGVEVVKLDVAADANVCYQLFMDTLSSHPDAKHIVFVCHTDEYCMAALNAATAAGRSDQIIATGCDCIDAAIDYLKQAHDDPDNYYPMRGSLNLDPKSHGKHILELVQKIYNGEDVPKDNVTSPYIVDQDTVYDVFP